MKPSQQFPISATFHRVTSKTKTPYLARVNGFGKRDMQPMIILVPAVVINNISCPPFARAIIVSSPSKYPDLTPGNTMIVNNFRSLSRIKLDGVPHSDAKTTPHVGCGACDRGDYQLGHHHLCPNK